MTAKKSATVRDTLNQRGQQYGSFAVNGKISQDFKCIAHGAQGWWTLEPYQREAVEIILHKFSRILTGDPLYVDSWRDIAGYSQLVVDQLASNPLATDAKVTIEKVNA